MNSHKLGAATPTLFGTDGIRGQANVWPITPDMVMRIAMAITHALPANGNRHRVIIGKDTRLSGYMIETSMVAGFTAAGADVFMAGPVPTPAIAMLTRSLRCDIGIMISASHNPYYDNGIKIFGSNGYKPSHDLELRIEKIATSDSHLILVPSKNIGRVKRITSVDDRYVEFVKRTIPSNLDLSGMKIVVDCANGAAYRVAPLALLELGANVVAIGTSPNGENINLDCGSTSPAALSRSVIENKADVGIAFDGDADRVVIVDEKGQVIGGDQLIALISKSFFEEGRLTRDGVVASIMSNLGLERYLCSLGLGLIRTMVGDRNVVEYMLRHGYNVGGEQSGHIVLSDHTTTGDGLVTALQVLSLIKRKDLPASTLCKCFDSVPQILKNVEITNKNSLDNDKIRSAIAQGAELLRAIGGRLIVRPSGTEPLVRIMAEGDDIKTISSVVDNLVCAITKVNA